MSWGGHFLAAAVAGDGSWLIRPAVARGRMLSPARRSVVMAVLIPRETPRTWQLQEVLVTEPSVVRRAIGAAAIGNVTEWYDFGVYAYFEPTIRKVFFSGLDETVGTIATFGLFAVAFL